MAERSGLDAAPSGRPAPLPLILIVDDSELTATALELACSDLPGADVRTLSSAFDAAGILAGGQPVAAVITDIRMPGMDGFQLLELIRAHPRHAVIPVIVVTGDTDPETPERLARLGADAVFPKPFSPALVRQTLERLLHANHSPNSG